MGGTGVVYDTSERDRKWGQPCFYFMDCHGAVRRYNTDMLFGHILALH